MCHCHVDVLDVLILVFHISPRITTTKICSILSSKQGHLSKIMENCRTIKPSWYSKYSRSCRKARIRKVSNIDIGDVMSALSSIEQEVHKSMLFKLMRAVRFLGKQGLLLLGKRT